MLSLQESAYIYDQGLGEPNIGEREHRRAIQLFWKVYSKGTLRRFWNSVVGNDNRLRSLGDMLEWKRVKTSHAAGIQNVPIVLIRGSEARCQDFDASFRPTNNRTEERWVSIATAQKLEIALPPVELIQVNEDYYVRDGHHRISVARSNGQMEIEAQVTRWELINDHRG